MKLVQESFNDTVMGSEKEMNFSISDDNPIIFEILRDKMYSNKIGSICREVSSNSRDANREAGNADLPIEITIIKPSDKHNIDALVGHLSISFKDYGVGITPDRMENVFVKYAASTKRDTNSQTGGFGLGAKTPFAYTDTFTIVTVCNWEGKLQRFTYTAMIDASRKGKMILFETEDVVGESTGTQIIIPINTPTDRDKFEQECVNYTSFWGADQVKYIGFDLDVTPNVIIQDTDQFTIYYNKNLEKKYKLLIDGVPYPLSRDYVNVSRLGLGPGYCLALKFGVGQLNISANRESIQYDDATVKKINQLYKDIKADILAMFVEKLSQADTYLEACIKHATVNSKFHDIRDIDDIDTRLIAYAFADGGYASERGILWDCRTSVLKSNDFQGKKIITRFTFNNHKVMFVKNPRFGDKVNYNEVGSFGISPRTVKIAKYYGDKKKNIRRNRTIWEAEVANDMDTFMLIVPQGDDIKAQNAEMAELQDLGLDFKMYGDVPMKKGESTYTKYVKQPEVWIKCREFNNSCSNSNTTFDLKVDRATLKIDPAQGKTKDFVYYVVDSLKKANDLCDYRKRSMFKALVKFGGKRVLIINQRSLNTYICKMKMKSAEDSFDALRTKQLAAWTVQRDLKAIRQFSRDCGFPEKGIEKFPEVFPKMLVDALTTEINKAHSFTELCGRKVPELDITNLKDEIALIKKKYPMLKPFLYQRGSGITVEEEAHVRNYIATVV